MTDQPQPPPWNQPYGQPPGSPPPPGYDAPPPGYDYPGYDPGYGYNYDHAYGYGPPGVGGPRTQPVGDDTTWALMCYIGTLIVGFLAPLIIYFVKKQESAFVRFHAAQTLNYTITVLIWVMAPFVLIIPLAILTDSPIWFVLGVPVWLFHIFAQYVFLILGAVKSGKGEYYRFPIWTSFPMIR